MAAELIELKNLGRTSVQWLHAVGIRDAQQLEDLGAVAAFCKIKERGFKVSKVLLYALEGALMDANWNKLDQEHKQRLLVQAKEQGANL